MSCWIVGQTLNCPSPIHEDSMTRRNEVINLQTWMTGNTLTVSPSLPSRTHSFRYATLRETKKLEDKKTLCRSADKRGEVCSTFWGYNVPNDGLKKGRGKPETVVSNWPLDTLRESPARARCWCVEYASSILMVACLPLYWLAWPRT